MVGNKNAMNRNKFTNGKINNNWRSPKVKKVSVTSYEKYIFTEKIYAV